MNIRKRKSPIAIAGANTANRYQVHKKFMSDAWVVRKDGESEMEGTTYPTQKEAINAARKLMVDNNVYQLAIYQEHGGIHLFEEVDARSSQRLKNFRRVGKTINDRRRNFVKSKRNLDEEKILIPKVLGRKTVINLKVR